MDEYQDTNRPQYELMRMLAGSEHNVCAVGDEDQSIYSWRGADIRNILEFEQDFPEARIIRLEQNYRSTQNILEAASVVVSHNVRRKGKNLWTDRSGGAQIGYYEAPDGENEALFAADYIAKYLRQAGSEGRETPRAAVLYRTNSQSRLVEEAMRRYQLNYHVVGGFSFYERAEIKDLISYLKVIQNPDDSIAVQRVINTPTRGIGKNTLETIESIALETGTSMWGAINEVLRRRLLPLRALTALKSFKDLIDDARAMHLGTFRERVNETAEPTAAEAFPSRTKKKICSTTSISRPRSSKLRRPRSLRPRRSPTRAPARARPAEAGEERVEGFRAPGDPASTAELLKFLIDRTGYIKQLEQEDTPEALARIENLHELVNAAMDSRDRGETLNEFLDHAALVSDADDYDENSRVTLMTLACGQRAGVSAGLSDWAGGETVSSFAHAAHPRRHRRGAATVLRRHDTRHGHADPFARALSAPLRDRHARAQRGLAVSGGNSPGAAAGPGIAATARACAEQRLRDRQALRLRG